MDDVQALIGLVKVGGPLSAAMAVAIWWLVKRVKKNDRDIRDDMKESHDRCEERNDKLLSEITTLRDATLRQNTEALFATSRALDRAVDAFGSSGTHPIYKKGQEHG